MATYSVHTLPPALATALGNAAKATCPYQPDGYTFTVTLSGVVMVKVVRGDAHDKRTSPIDWKRVAMALAARLPASQRRSFVRDVLAGITNGTLLDFDSEIEAEAKAIVAAANAAKPSGQQPGQQKASVTEATITVA